VLGVGASKSATRAVDIKPMLPEVGVDGNCICLQSNQCKKTLVVVESMYLRRENEPEREENRSSGRDDWQIHLTIAAYNHSSREM
jgi:hypothetical protein